MGIVTSQRSLDFRHVLPAAVSIAPGIYAYFECSGIARTAEQALPDNQTVATLAQSAALHILLVAVAAAVVTAVLLALTMHFTISRPLEALAATTADLKASFGGDVEPTADPVSTLDAIAQDLETVRAGLDRGKSSVPELVVTPDPRHQVVKDRVDRFGIELEGYVRRLSATASSLRQASGHMTEAAKHASEGSEQATSASSHAAGDVSSVASASEQLLASIEEISRQVVQSTSVVRAAVERAIDTNAGMGRLSSAAQKVGDVVSLISRIAAQTNLLALNATIEAARAGEAGRGFAVVAQEVKTLATQTAKATQDITGQITEMQQATDLSVEAIDKIQAKIAEVEHISTIIASAVHEQGAATHEIARNVRSAASGTTNITSHIENVVRSVTETSTSAASVSALARELDEIALGMTDMVGSFGRTLKMG